MGTNIKDIVSGTEISIKDLKNKILVVDSFNVLYQFLSTIRMRDGSLLRDSKGNVTSHLIGLFSRTTSLMEQGLKLAFVFDGKPPELKTKERERRKEAKEKAQKEYEAARDREDIVEMKKYAQRTARLTPEMVEEAKKLIHALGLPVIQAPSEGEAQAAYLVKSGQAYAEISQDYDCLLFGVPRMIKNLTLSQRKKQPSKLSYETIHPEMLTVDGTLKQLEITQNQLIALGMLIGTDFNPGGISGIGPKKGLKLIKEHCENFSELFTSVKWDESHDSSWQEVFDIIKNMPVDKNIEMEWTNVDENAIKKLLIDEHEFSTARVENTLDRLHASSKANEQRGLGDFI